MRKIQDMSTNKTTAKVPASLISQMAEAERSIRKSETEWTCPKAKTCRRWIAVGDCEHRDSAK
jgi:hypothetical protein